MVGLVFVDVLELDVSLTVTEHVRHNSRHWQSTLAVDKLSERMRQDPEV